jgi:hydroxylamine reductase
MFCYQCQETAKNEGCKVRGVCGKTDEVATLQDLLIYVLKGISIYADKAKEFGIYDESVGLFVTESLFTTVTNVNFDEENIAARIRNAFGVRETMKTLFLNAYKAKHGHDFSEPLPPMTTWQATTIEAFLAKGKEIGVMATTNEDVRSLRELLTYGVKGVAAYADHAYILGGHNPEIFAFLMEGLAATTNDTLSADELTGLVLKCGKIAVDTMALLDQFNTETYGHPEATEVNLNVRQNPGILISGHDLKDLAELLEQTQGSGVDVYTHSEMLPANSYPAFKKYSNLVGNYGSSWWNQPKEFETFNGPILMTTNCLVPPRDTYKERLFTTGLVAFKGVKHIPNRPKGGKKDFSAIIALAKNCPPPQQLEDAKLVGGLAHESVMAVADKVIAAVKAGLIKRFVVMAGCDGRHKDRDYFTEVAKSLPQDTVILTAGCAKYRYNKLNLGNIGGIPRVIDAGQCNDSYSLAYIALKLKDVFGVQDINELPISYDIAWYEQKAVAVLLALLFLGVKGIRLGPTLPAFLSPNVVNVLVKNFNIKPTSTVEADVQAMMAGN